jgi:hypothetical protein
VDRGGCCREEGELVDRGGCCREERELVDRGGCCREEGEHLLSRTMRPTRGRDVDSSHNLQLSQIASTFPAPRKGSPPDSIFWVGQPHASPVWLAGLRLALSGDIETNPGPFFCRSCHIALFHFCCFENHFCKPPKFPKSCRLCHLPFCNFCCYLKHFCLLIPITNKQSHQQNFSHSTSQNSNNISQTKKQTQPINTQPSHTTFHSPQTFASQSVSSSHSQSTPNPTNTHSSCSPSHTPQTYNSQSNSPSKITSEFTTNTQSSHTTSHTPQTYCS